MVSLEKAYGAKAPLVRKLYAHVEAGDVDSLRAQLGMHPELLASAGCALIGYPGLLHRAAEENQIAVCALLVGMGIDLDQPTVGSGNATALALAAQNGHVETVRWLLDAGADVDGAALSVVSPLMSAVTFGKQDVVELLLDHHPDLNRVHAKLGLTALDLARSWNFPEIFDRLQARGAVSAREAAPDEAALPGAAIVEFVRDTVGWVLPSGLVPQPESVQVNFRVSRIADRNDFKLLFTVGLFAVEPRTELFLCLPGSWRLPMQGFAAGSPWMFPRALLEALADTTLQGTPVTEGRIISRADEAFACLGWPADIDALMVVDKRWNSADDAVHEGHDDTVKLYVLVPLKLPKKGAPEGDALLSLLEKKRKASWKSIALTSPLQS